MKQRESRYTITFFASFVAVTFIAIAIFQHRKIASLELALQEASTRISKERFAIQAPEEFTGVLPINAAKSSVPIPDLLPPRSAEPSPDRSLNEKANSPQPFANTMSKYAASIQLAQMAKHISLTEEEKEEISAAIQSEMNKIYSGKEFDSSQTSDERIKEILGEKRYDEYKEKQQKDFENMRTLEREKEVAFLAKRLTLTADEERVLADALKKTGEAQWDKLMDHSSEKMAQMVGNDDDSFDLAESIEESADLASDLQRAKTEALMEELKGKLSDEQLNSLFKYYAEQPDFDWGALD